MNTDDKRPQFGNRFLINEEDVFQHNAWLCHTRFRKKPLHGSRFLIDKLRIFDFNAWDDVHWDEAQEAVAKGKVSANSATKMDPKLTKKYETEANRYWDEFYSIHTNGFFKDRHWLFTEFPELNFSSESLQFRSKQLILEVGCGVGNTVFPILQYSKHNDFYIYACDFSKEAIEILKKSPDYDENKCNAFVLDVTSDQWETPFQENSLDIVILIFVLSAIQPDRFKYVMTQLHQYVKPGGLILFRDYGRYDLAQLRFKPGRCLADNFYVRGDGTRVYFFNEEEVEQMFESVGFVKEEVHVDRRLQVNRGRLLKMYRVWIQAKYRKPIAQ